MRQPIPESREVAPRHAEKTRTDTFWYALGRFTHDLQVPKCRVVPKVVGDEFVEGAAVRLLDHALSAHHNALEIDADITQRAAPLLRRAPVTAG